MSIIAISGYIDTEREIVGKIIQYLIARKGDTRDSKILAFEFLGLSYSNWKSINNQQSWKIKKFETKRKQIVSILTGIPVEELEKDEVKDRVLGNEWCRIITTLPLSSDVNKIIKERNYTNAFFDQTDKSFIVYQKITVRQLMVEIATDVIPNVIHHNIWCNALFADYVKLCDIHKEGNRKNCMCYRESDDSTLCESEKPNWIITDLRFENEFKAIKDRKGITIRVNRNISKYGSINDNKKLEHPSETALDLATFDYVIDNNEGIPELIEKVREILIKEKVL